MLNLFGVSFHLYGLIVGLALVMGIFLVEYRVKQESINEDKFWTVLTWLLVGGLVLLRKRRHTLS